MITREFVESFDSMVRQATKVVVTAHMGPDDDSISSVLGLYWYLTTTYPALNVSMLYTGERSERWSYFEYYDRIEFIEDIAERLDEFDLVIMLDVSQFNRVMNNISKKETFKGRTICIDHHKNIPDQFDLAYIDSQSPANSAVLYDLFYSKASVIPRRVAEVVLLGILGDTGSFTYIQPTQSKVLLVAERLMREAEISIQELKGRYMKYSDNVFRLIQVFMKNFTIEELGEWGKFSLTYIERDECSRITTRDLDVSAASHIFIDSYAKAIQGVDWGMIYYPKFEKDEFSASFRSLPQGVNVRVIAQGMGVGGGHDLASGGKFPRATSARECIDMVINWLQVNKVTRYF